MSSNDRLRARRLRVSILAGAALAWLAPAATPAPGEEKPPDQETELGQATFEELKAKGEIIESSSLYDALLPVIDPILRTAQPRYEHPFKVYLVHEPQPNAFAAPGGNIYVTDALLYFAKSKEQLAGTLCHEVAHTIHHDTMTLLQKQKLLRAGEVGAAILLGPTRAHVLAIALLGKLRSLSYSRDVESRADLTGADICAAAGSNPWGLVWLFQEFKNAKAGEVPQLLSDHPSNQHRIDALQRHFREDPSVFGSFNPDRAPATPFSVPEKTAVVFLR